MDLSVRNRVSGWIVANPEVMQTWVSWSIGGVPVKTGFSVCMVRRFVASEK
jgi:hypothetical protein